MSTRPRLFVMAADGDGAVGVMEHVVADAAEDGASNEAETASAHHDHRCVFRRRQLHDRLARTRPELDHNPSAHLTRDNRNNAIP